MSTPTAPPVVFDLEQPRTENMPIHPNHKPGYSYVLHRRHTDDYGQDGPRSGASGLIVCKEHSGTHIDALCHQAEHMIMLGVLAAARQYAFQFVCAPLKFVGATGSPVRPIAIA